MELKGRTALITGAGVRIGRAIARTLACSGAHIVIHYRHSKNEAAKLRKEIELMGGRAYLAQADFSARSKPLLPEIKHFIEDVYKQAGKIDILVNNASVFYPTPLEEISEADWDENLTVNLKAPFFLAREIGVRMKKQKSGKIINLVDWSGMRPYSNYLPYCIAKAGLINATYGLAKALAPHVQVMGIAPGPILPAKGASDKQKKAAAERSLLKRFGDPEDIAQAVRFFIEGTDFITGAVLPVDGGALIA